MKAGELIKAASEQVAELTGHRVETVSSLSKNGDGWVVRVETLELERVPNTMDILATYEVTLSDDGELVGFKRGRRYHRSATDEGDD